MILFSFILVFTILQFNGNHEAYAARCRKGEFRCSDNKCIIAEYKCDGKPDCVNGEDELVCPSRCDAPGEFKCPGSEVCLLKSKVCNQVEDCLNGEDEKECDKRSCGDNEFACTINRGQCIPSNNKCDGTKDCFDGTDEVCLGPDGAVCKVDEYTCKSGACINKKYLCDNRADCMDKSDEDIAICTAIKKQAAENCDLKTMFKCDDDVKCLSQSKKCDRTVDCTDGTDEAGCQITPVTPIEISNHCTPGAGKTFSCGPFEDCITESQRCDGFPDCLDSRDEKHCKNKTCGSYKFLCPSNMMCISKALKCNGENNCPDGSDEKGCIITNVETKSKCDPALQFDCFNDGSKCIDIKLVCDKKNDCSKLGEDERPDDNYNNCRFDRCSHNKGNCEHFCHNHFTKRVCSCKSGFKVANDGVSCVDINECEETSGACSQICVNQPGDFKCDCRQGYIKSHNNATRCEITGEKFLLYTFGRSIHEMRMKRNSRKVVESDNLIIDMDYDLYQSDNPTLFWSEIPPGKRAGRIMRADLHATAVLHGEAFVTEGINQPDGIAYDWLNKLLFWTDKTLGQISVINVTSGDHTIIVSENVYEPRSIVLDPLNGLLYWAEVGNGSRIECIGMNGQGRTVLVDENIETPGGLAYDDISNHLYWGDMRRRSISVLNLESRERRVLLQDGLIYPFSLSVFEDKLYWSDWVNMSVRSMNKFTGKDVEMVAKTDAPFGIRILHQMKQPRALSVCLGHYCSHLCLPAPRMSSTKRSTLHYTCACPLGMRLLDDGKRCVKDHNWKQPSQWSLYESRSSNTTRTQAYVDHSKLKSKYSSPKYTEREHHVGYIATAVIAIIFFVTVVGSLVGFLLHRNYIQRVVKVFERGNYDTINRNGDPNAYEDAETQMS